MTQAKTSTDNKPNILIVDDEKDNLMLLSNLLKDDLNIMLAKSGEQAIEKVDLKTPDIIMLDVIMPGMDGFETLSKLKEKPELHEVPVIFLTGEVSPEKEKQGLTLGAQDYIHKPFRPSVVKARVFTQLKLLKQQRELKELSTRLKEADEAKSRFLANMSHEIRTPLTLIIGYSDALSLGEMPSDQLLDAMETISSNGKHLLNLVNDILDLSKVEANKLDVEHIDTSLPDLIEEIRALVQPKVKQKGLDFNITIEFPMPVTVNTDPGRAKQILLNLITNAIKFTEVGSVTLEVFHAQNTLHFAVIDTGIGMTPPVLENLFEAFEQASDDINRKFGGTGLGLNISKQLAKRLGGDVTVTSEPDVGSRFDLTIMNHSEDSPHLATSQQQWQQACSIGKSSRDINLAKLSGKVLVAEDQHQIRDIIASMLEHANLDVTMVENGEQLIEAVGTDSFDLILSDIQMPEIDGLTALETLRKKGVTAPVIALTAYAMTHEVDEFRQAGFSDHIAKPIDRERFFNTLQKYL